jgi:hypothetical protein
MSWIINIRSTLPCLLLPKFTFKHPLKFFSGTLHSESYLNDGTRENVRGCCGVLLLHRLSEEVSSGLQGVGIMNPADAVGNAVAITNLS